LEALTVKVPAVFFITELLPGMVMFEPATALNVPELFIVQVPALQVMGVALTIKLPELVMVLPDPALKLKVDDVALILPELIMDDEDPPLMV
jgi:hypothetical protein